jgi:AAA family ATP:ADP antiporter
VRSLSAHPIRRFVQVEPGEGWTLTLSAALFAWLLGAYYLIQPTREAFGISAGPIYEWLWTGTATATLVATPIYGWAVARFPRNRFAPGLYLGAALALVAFWFAHGAAEGTVRRSIGYAFYIFVSTLAVFATTLFWAMMADGHRPDAARRMFGVRAENPITSLRSIASFISVSLRMRSSASSTGSPCCSMAPPR